LKACSFAISFFSPELLNCRSPSYYRADKRHDQQHQPNSELRSFHGGSPRGGQRLVRLNRENQRGDYCNADQRNDKCMANWKMQILDRHIADWAMQLVAAGARTAMLTPVHPDKFTTSAKKKPVAPGPANVVAMTLGWMDRQAGASMVGADGGCNKKARLARRVPTAAKSAVASASQFSGAE
jgi:hypothetical protein